MEATTDEELVRRAKTGRQDSFTELARRYQERIYRTVYSFTRNPLDADDLTQETFMQAYRNIPGFREQSSFFTWIYRIAVNLTLNHLKKHRREKDREVLSDNVLPSVEPGSAGASPEAHSLSGELRRRMAEAVQDLPFLYKAAFELVAVQGMSHGQAARVLGCAENTVSWRMHRARKMLQERLKPYLSGEAPHALR